jgi:flagellar hook-basal body complex protein FliE
MKQRILLLTLATMLFISLSPLASWGAAPEQQAATQDESQQKKHYEKNMQERLGKLGKQVDELKAKAAAMTEQARKDIKQDLAEVEKKRESASRKLETMRKESATAWEKFSAELDKAADDFENAFKKAKERFKEKQ